MQFRAYRSIFGQKVDLFPKVTFVSNFEGVKVVFMIFSKLFRGSFRIVSALFWGLIVQLFRGFLNPKVDK